MKLSRNLLQKIIEEDWATGTSHDILKRAIEASPEAVSADVFDSSVFEEISDTQEYGRINAFSFEAGNRVEHANEKSSERLLLSLNGTSLMFLCITSATANYWAIPYCALGLLGVFFMQVSR